MLICLILIWGCFKKYGKRPDDRLKEMRQLFYDLSQQLSSNINVSSDECPFYKGIVMRYFPAVNNNQYLGEKECVAIQGELKKAAFEPIFSINHTFR